MVSKSLHERASSHPLCAGKVDPLAKGSKTAVKICSSRLRPKFSGHMMVPHNRGDVSRSGNVSFLVENIQTSMKLISVNELTNCCDIEDELAEFVLDVPRSCFASQMWGKREHAQSFEPRPAKRNIFSSFIQGPNDAAHFSAWDRMNTETDFQEADDLCFQKHFDSGEQQMVLTPPKAQSQLRMRLNQTSNPFKRDIAAVSCDITAVSLEAPGYIAHSAASYDPTTSDDVIDNPYLQTPNEWSSCDHRCRPFPASIYLPDF